MIAFVRGRVATVTLSSAVLEVGGVGLELMCTPATLAGLHIGQEATLPSSMIVREDSMTLYGFADDDEKSIFELMQTASGVGPKVAQAIVAVLDPDGVRTAIAGEDVKTLTKVPGIGQKGAQRIILELKDRIGAPAGTAGSGRAIASAAPWRDQVHQALIGLGYSTKDAERAVDAVSAQADAGASANVGSLLRAALQTLSKA